MVGVLVVALTDPVPFPRDVSSDVVCELCKLPITLLTVANAAGLEETAEETTLDSAPATESAIRPPLKSIGPLATAPSTSSAAVCDAVLSVTPGAAETTENTAAAAATGLALVFWLARPARMLVCTADTATNAAALFVAEADAASTVSALATLCTAPLEAFMAVATMLVSTLSAAVCVATDSVALVFVALPAPTTSTLRTSDADAAWLEVTLSDATLLSRPVCAADKSDAVRLDRAAVTAVSPVAFESGSSRLATTVAAALVAAAAVTDSGAGGGGGGATTAGASARSAAEKVGPL